MNKAYHKILIILQEETIMDLFLGMAYLYAVIRTLIMLTPTIIWNIITGKAW